MPRSVSAAAIEVGRQCCTLPLCNSRGQTRTVVNADFAHLDRTFIFDCRHFISVEALDLHARPCHHDVDGSIATLRQGTEEERDTHHHCSIIRAAGDVLNSLIKADLIHRTLVCLDTLHLSRQRSHSMDFLLSRLWIIYLRTKPWLESMAHALPTSFPI